MTDSALDTADTDQQTKTTAWRWVLVGIGGLAMLFFASFGIDRSIWLDESFSINLASKNFQGIFEGLKSDGHPPFYFLLLSAWMHLFGDGEAAARSLSGLLYILSIFGVYALASVVLRDRRAGLIAAILYLASKTTVAHAQNARMYSLLGCLVVYAHLFYYQAFIREDGNRRAAIPYVIIVLLGTFTHFWFCFAVLAQSIGALVKGRRRLGFYILSTAVATLPFAVLWLPVFFEHQIYNGVADWMDGRHFGLGTLMATLADYYGEGSIGGLFWLAIAVLCFLPEASTRTNKEGTASESFLRQRATALLRFSQQSPASFFALLFAISLLAPLLVSQIRPIYRIGSYTIIGLPPLVIVTAAFLHRFAPRRLLPWFLVCLICGAMAGFGWMRSTPEISSDRQAAHYLLEQMEDRQGADQGGGKDVVLFTSLSRSAVEYYLRRAGADSLHRFSFPSEIDQHPGWRSPSDQEKRIAELDREAARFDQELRRSLGPEDRLWMFYGSDTGISNLLKDRLETWLVQTDAVDFPTGFYHSILLYERTAEEKAVGETDEITADENNISSQNPNS